MLKAWRPWGMPQPVTTSSTEPGSTSGLRSISWSSTLARVSSGRSWASEPLKALPMGVRIASTITASGMGSESPWRRSSGEVRPDRLLGRHPQGPVQPDGLAVQHGVLGDVAGQLGELAGAPEPRREGHLLAELLALILRE